MSAWMLFSAVLLGAPAAEETAEPPVLELVGTPEIPDALRERMAQYLNTRSSSLSALGDSGQHMLVSTRFGDTRQIHRVDGPGMARTQLTFGDEPLSGVWELPDQGALLVRSDVGGTERYQLSRLDLATGRRTLLTDPDFRHGGVELSPDRTRIAWTSNASNGKDGLVYVADTGGSLGTDTPLFAAEGTWYTGSWTRDGTHLVVGRYISATHAELYRVDATTGERTALHPPEVEASVSWGLPSADGGTFYVVSDHEGDFRRLYAVSLAGKRRPKPVYSPLTADIPWDVEGLALSPDGGTLVVAVNEQGWSRLWLLDTATGEKRQLADTPKGRISGLGFAREAPVLGFTLSSATAPSDPWTWTAEGGFTRWVTSEIGGLDPASFVAPELIEVASFDGTRVPAWVYKPPGEGPFPVVISFHGGPEAQARPRFHSSRQYLALESGIASVVPNVRGSRGYGRDYLLADNGLRREDSVQDVGALLDWIDAQPDLDGDRVAVSGGSYGGYMVLGSLVHYSDRLVAGVDFVGISHFVTFLENTKAYRQDLRRVEYGDERDPQMRAHLDAISPLNRASEIDAALFVAHGANDPRVPVGEARQIAEAVRANDQEVWLMVAHNEGHGFRKKDNADTYRLLWILFMEQMLLARPAEGAP